MVSPCLMFRCYPNVSRLFGIIVWPAVAPLLSHVGKKDKDEVRRSKKHQRIKGNHLGFHLKVLSVAADVMIDT